MSSPTLIAGYLALFTLVGFLFIFVNLLIGSLVRPKAPNVEKLEVYECGEPTIGSSFVQFDLRFYVVALLFIIFDVEVALFFPWAVVYGKSTQLMDQRFEPVVVAAQAGAQPQLAPAAKKLMSDLGVPQPELPSRDLVLKDFRKELENELLKKLNKTTLTAEEKKQIDSQIAAKEITVAGYTEFVRPSVKKLALISICDILAFFGVLMVGFAYVWYRGDLDWVRAVSRDRGKRTDRPLHDFTDSDLEPTLAA